MVKRLLLACFIGSLCIVNGFATNNEDANKPIIEFAPGVRTYYPDRVGYSPNTSLLEALQGAPQLILNRHTTILNGWGLYVNSSTYLQDPIIFLSQTKVSEIQYISFIYEDFTNLEGVNGIINVIMKSAVEGFHGEANLMTGTDASLYPSLSLSYKKNRWSVVGSFMGLWDHDETSTLNYDADKSPKQFNFSNSSKSHYADETAKLTVEYQSPKDFLQLNIFQKYDPVHTKATQIKDDAYSYTNQRDNRLMFYTQLKYIHTFNSNYNLTVKITESNSRTTTDLDADYAGLPYEQSNLLKETNDSRLKSNSLGSLVIFSMSPLTPLNIKTGFIASLASYNNDYRYSMIPINEIATATLGGLNKVIVKNPFYDVSTSNFMPYVQLSYKFSKFTLNVGDQFMIRHHKVADESISMNKDWNKSYFNNMVSSRIEWKPSAQHGVMLSYSRRVTTPPAMQLYPYTTFANMHTLLTGNENLKPTVHHIYDLHYTYNGKKVSTNFTIRYYDSDNVLYSVSDLPINVAGMQETYTHMENNADTHTLNTSASLLWQEKYFSLAAGIDYFNSRNTYLNGSNSKDDFYSCRISPVVKLPKDINFSSTLIYYSKEKHIDYELDPYWWLSLRFTKQWNHFNLYAQWENALNKTTNSYYHYTTKTTISEINDNYNALSIGCAYNF